jgi:hypothetical protein
VDTYAPRSECCWVDVDNGSLTVDRLAGDGHHTIADEMEQVKVKGLHRVEIRDAKGHPMTVTLELRYQRMTVLPPIGKQSRYPAL